MESDLVADDDALDDLLLHASPQPPSAHGAPTDASAMNSSSFSAMGSGDSLALSIDAHLDRLLQSQSGVAPTDSDADIPVATTRIDSVDSAVSAADDYLRDIDRLIGDANSMPVGVAEPTSPFHNQSDPSLHHPSYVSYHDSSGYDQSDNNITLYTSQASAYANPPLMSPDAVILSPATTHASDDSMYSATSTVDLNQDNGSKLAQHKDVDARHMQVGKAEQGEEGSLIAAVIAQMGNLNPGAMCSAGQCVIQ